MPQVHGKQMIDRRRVTTGMAALAASLAAPRVARAETAAEFYRGKTVRILVGSPPGGGYDIYARLVTPALAAKLGATVLVENKDGNGGLAALATLLARPADGLTIMNGSAEAAIISQMLGRPGATWDVTKLNWLAKMASAPKLWFVGKDARYQSIAAALQADPLTWSATGPADDISDVQATISYVLGLKSKIVTGYRGSGDMSLAVIRNEVDCRPAVGGFGAATHRRDQAAGGVRRQALGRICPMCRHCAKPRRCPPTRPGS